MKASVVSFSPGFKTSLIPITHDWPLTFVVINETRFKIFLRASQIFPDSYKNETIHRDSTGGIVGGKNVALARCKATANVSAWLRGGSVEPRPCSQAVTQPVLRNSAAAPPPLRKTGARTPAPLWSSLIKDNQVNNTNVAQPAAASGGRSALLNGPRAKTANRCPCSRYNKKKNRNIKNEKM